MFGKPPTFHLPPQAVGSEWLVAWHGLVRQMPFGPFSAICPGKSKTGPRRFESCRFAANSKRGYDDNGRIRTGAGEHCRFLI